MAKDGTARGGSRVGAGRKRKALADRIADGTTYGAMVLFEPDDLEPGDLGEVDENPPPVKEYLKASQKVGELCAEEIFNDTWNWLKERGCEKLVNVGLLEEYAMNKARWIQCENIVSDYGFLAKHPTTGAAMTSPYISIASGYAKTATNIWYQIGQIVKENCSVAYDGSNPNDDLMEKLLRARS